MRTNAQLFVQIPVLTPERKIWRAVLEQAFADAEGTAEFDPHSGSAIRAIARRFLRAAGPYEAHILARVCDFAEVPYDRVVLWARQRYPSEPAELEPLEEIIADELMTDEILAIDLSNSRPN